MAITTQASNVELAAEFADFAYSDEGHLLFNFGIEGESYTWVTDYSGFEGTEFPRYTELMWNNPDGKTLAQMGGLYTRAFYAGPIVQDRRYIYQYAHRPAQREAIQLWAQTEADNHKLPLITATPDESEELAAIMSEVNTYRDEMVVRFITGQESLDNFDQFLAQLERMGIERAIEIRQAGLDRYLAR
jgi:putative aldouronate transport system substrate-binding protein